MYLNDLIIIFNHILEIRKALRSKFSAVELSDELLTPLSPRLCKVLRSVIPESPETKLTLESILKKIEARIKSVQANGVKEL